MLEQLFWSLTHRPYVTLFLLAFVTLSWVEQGKLRTLIWVISGYAIALCAEWGSINHGFPFGWYIYHYDQLANDLVIFGVPFFDTLSFSFLSYVSFSFAQYFMSPLWIESMDLQRVTARRVRNSVPVALLGGMLMTVIDLIVDPVTHLGKHWFLGDIYHYPDPGIHFGVTLANYGGWFLVGFTIIFVNQRIDTLLAAKERVRGVTVSLPRMRFKGLFAPCFWTGIVLFQLGVTYWLGFGDHPEIDHDRVQLQALTGTFIILPILALMAVQLVKPSNRATADEIRLWREQYPVR